MYMPEICSLSPVNRCCHAMFKQPRNELKFSILLFKTVHIYRLKLDKRKLPRKKKWPEVISDLQPVRMKLFGVFRIWLFSPQYFHGIWHAHQWLKFPRSSFYLDEWKHRLGYLKKCFVLFSLLRIYEIVPFISKLIRAWKGSPFLYTYRGWVGC